MSASDSEDRTELVDGGRPYSLPWDPTIRGEVTHHSRHATQTRIYNCILANPGIHLRKIGRDLDLAIGDVQYHLHRLEDEGMVRSVRRGLYRFFYPSALFKDEHFGTMLTALAQETPRELLLSLIEMPYATQEDLSRVTGLSQPTISWHMKRLVELKVVERHQRGRFVSYLVAGDAAEIARFIRSYHPTVWEKWSGRLTDVVLAFSRENGKR